MGCYLFNLYGSIKTMSGRTARIKGFTIVELLIVVVIIAILAAVTIVAYNGIQTRAENAKTSSAVSTYVKAITMYATQNGTYPITASWPCLGTVASCGRVSGATSCLGAGAAVTDATFMNDMKTILPTLPEPSTQRMNCAGNSYAGAFYNKNDTSSGKSASIFYYLRGDQDCTVSGGASAKDQQDDTTRCSITLPTLP